jgi:hypothetical protein
MYYKSLLKQQSKSEPNNWNAVLALDAKNNHYRFHNLKLSNNQFLD